MSNMIDQCDPMDPAPQCAHVRWPGAHVYKDPLRMSADMVWHLGFNLPAANLSAYRICFFTDLKLCLAHANHNFEMCKNGSYLYLSEP